MINWKQKLTSRKLWMAVASFITAILAFVGTDEDTVLKVSALIMAGASAIAYIIGEGLVDATREEPLPLVDEEK
jgi:cytochrome c biogenesis factor